MILMGQNVSDIAMVCGPQCIHVINISWENAGCGRIDASRSQENGAAFEQSIFQVEGERPPTFPKPPPGWWECGTGACQGSTWNSGLSHDGVLTKGALG